MNIYTYYQHIPDMNWEDQEKLIEVWKENWSRAGWTPSIIGVEHAKMNPRYEEYLAVFSQFPTTNHKDYELSCFLRWVAMEYIGDGMLVDYDVMNYGFNEEMATHSVIPYAYNVKCVPCSVSASTQGFSYLLSKLISYGFSGKTHVSDQSALQEMQVLVPGNLCSEYKEHDKWFKSPLVHFPYGRTDMHGLTPRWKFVKEINDLIYRL